ncbi:Crp/Fnr family transcriptional regulator [Aminivibrio sp.]|uniref:Crp/Fnr family transcriptional regulator n=1 Tax=Aminivibrio sp. TaxID=1872489 RepID=UPI00345E1612
MPLFKSLSHDEMMEIASITEPRTFKKGEVIYGEGDTGGKLYILHTGGVKISRLSADGKEQFIRAIGPGEFMGELSLFSSLPFTDDAAALENSTMCFIDGEKLKLLMSKYISIAFKVMDELSKRLERAENLIKEISLNSVEERLARVLLDLSDGEKEIVLTMTRGNLASQLGMSQETLSRKLSFFQEEGLISLKGHKRIRIENREGLLKII